MKIRFTRYWLNVLCMILGLCLAPAAHAQDVALTSADGSLTVEGRLLGFDSEYYQIRSAYGDLTLDGSGVVCSGPACPSLDAFVARARFAGSAVLGQNLMPVLLEGFAREEGLLLSLTSRDDLNFTYVLSDDESGLPVGEFVFSLNDSQDGAGALEKEEADFALTRFAIEVPDLPAPRVLALDALTLSVSQDNPVRAVPLTALTRIATDKITNWNELGGPDLEFFAVGKAEDAISLNQILNAHDQVVAGRAVMDQVQHDSLVLGFTRLSEPGAAVPLRLSGACGADFVPSAENLKTRDYPLTSPQYLYQSKQRKPRLIRQFLRYLATDAAARDVGFSGFVSPGLDVVPMAAQGDRITNAVLQAGTDTSLEDLQTMLQGLAGAARMTMTFRFQAGSSRLDAQSVAEMDVLIQQLETGRFDGKELIFAGFSDGEGGADANRRIALRRASSVRDALRRGSDILDEAGVALTVSGFGEAMPLACDDTEAGRQLNRRVELWVRDVPTNTLPTEN